MTSIYKTAYPYFSNKKRLSQEQVQERYTLTDDERQFILKSARGADSRLTLAVLFKVYQDFNYFPAMADMPEVVVMALRQQLQTSSAVFMMSHRATIKRMKDKIYGYFKVTHWYNKSPGKTKPHNPAKRQILKLAEQSAFIRNYPADIINEVIEHCYAQRIELPSFKQLSRLVRHVRFSVNSRIFKKVQECLPYDLCAKFDALLITSANTNRSEYNQLKFLPKNPTITHFRELLAHHDWLFDIGKLDTCFDGLSQIKLHQFAEQARSLDASNHEDFLPPKRYTLIACLLAAAQRQAKDALSETFCKSMRSLNKRGIRKLTELQETYRKRTFELLNVFSDVLVDVKEKSTHWKSLAKSIITTIDEAGGAELLHQDCEQAAALNSKNHLPLIWKMYQNNRSVYFRLIRTLAIHSCSQNDKVLLARDFLLQHENRKAEFLPAQDLDLSFASQAWRKLIIKSTGDEIILNRRHLEVCVFMAIAEGLNANDLYVEGAGSYKDYRVDLVPWQACEALLPEYCNTVGRADNAHEFTKNLKNSLRNKAKYVNTEYPNLAELEIDENGTPTLKRRAAKEPTKKMKWLQKMVKERMPERNIIDVLTSSHFYSGWAHQFGPVSGDEPKIEDAIVRYILTTFAYGSAMRPTQTAKHLKGKIQVSAHMLSYINRRHVNIPMLEAACKGLINYINQFPILKAWGNGSAVAADGTLEEIHEQTLLSEFHQRYMKRGGIAYHHVADNYVLLFSTFMPCGVWEAVEIIDGLLKNESDIQPTIIHADTQGQSTIVFAIAYLLGFKLMPRIRNWNDLILFRPDPHVVYDNVDSLFSDPINWDRIEEHWQDMMQVILSIREGKMSSATLLRKLGSYSKRNHLYKAFQELGRVIRTLFLLEFISDVELRETITAQTNKVEQYNELSDWCRFGGQFVAASNEDIEIEKAIKYNDLLANAVILQNVVDITNVVGDLRDEGYDITKEEVGSLSPYLTSNHKRFGDYIVDLNHIPKSADRARRLVLWQ